jgi:hypothetical protein
MKSVMSEIFGKRIKVSKAVLNVFSVLEKEAAAVKRRHKRILKLNGDLEKVMSMLSESTNVVIQRRRESNVRVFKVMPGDLKRLLNDTRRTLDDCYHAALKMTHLRGLTYMGSYDTLGKVDVVHGEIKVANSDPRKALSNLSTEQIDMIQLFCDLIDKELIILEKKAKEQYAQVHEIKTVVNDLY